MFSFSKPPAPASAPGPAAPGPLFGTSFGAQSGAPPAKSLFGAPAPATATATAPSTFGSSTFGSSTFGSSTFGNSTLGGSTNLSASIDSMPFNADPRLASSANAPLISPGPLTKPVKSSHPAQLNHGESTKSLFSHTVKRSKSDSDDTHLRSVDSEYEASSSKKHPRLFNGLFKESQKQCPVNNKNENVLHKAYRHDFRKLVINRQPASPWVKNMDLDRPRMDGESQTRFIIDNIETDPATNAKVENTDTMKSETKTMKSETKTNDPTATGSTVTVSQAAIDEGYWCSPPLTTLAQLPTTDLSHVENFRVGHRDSGHQIAFTQPVDLTTLSNLGDLFGQIIIFEPKYVTVYPDETTKPALGQGLNVPATITLANIHLRDRRTQCSITDPADPRVGAHIEKLKSTLAANDGEHISWGVTSGEWVFRVPHFSIWGIVDDDDYDDEDNMSDNEFIATTEQPPVVTVKESTPPVFVLREPIKPADRSRQIPGAWGSNEIVSPSAKSVVEIPQFEPVYSDEEQVYSDEEKIDSNEEQVDSDEDMVSDVEESEPSEISDVELELEDNIDYYDNDEDNNQIIAESNYTHPPASTWLQQLKIAASLDSPLSTFDQKKEDTDEINAKQMDELIFGTPAIPAIEKPLGRTGGSFARFGPNGRLITTNFDSLKIKSINELSYDDQDHNLSQQLARAQLKHSTLSITREKNQIPTLTINPETFTFQFLAQTVMAGGNNDDKTNRERQMWQLASLLFDSDETVGIKTRFGGAYSPEAQARLREQQRRAKLSHWLENVVAQTSSSSKTTSSPSSELDNIWQFIASHRIAEAAMLASTSSNPHLAVLITLLGSDDPSIKTAAESQLIDWKSPGYSLVPTVILKIYELLAGNTDKSTTVSGVDMTQGLSWYQCFGLQLWYGSDYRAALDDAVNLYKVAMVERYDDDTTTGDGLAAAPETHDINFALLDLYNNLDDGDKWLNCVRGAGARVNYYLHLTLRAKYTNHHNNHQQQHSQFDQLGPALTGAYILQLQSAGLWQEALVASLILKDDKLAYETVASIVSLNVDHNNNEIMDLMQECQLPLGLLAQSAALACRYSGDHVSETQHLLEAQSFEEAHGTILAHVGPAAIIADDDTSLNELARLLAQFPSVARRDMGSKWTDGGAVYADYTDLVIINRDHDDNNNDRFERLEPMLNRLTLALKPYNNRHFTNPNIKGFSLDKVAASIVNQTVIEQITRWAPVRSELHDRLVDLSSGCDHGLSKTRGVVGVYLERLELEEGMDV